MRPDLLVTPDVQHFDSIDIYKTKKILAPSEQGKQVLKRGLDRKLNAKSGQAIQK